MQHTTRVRHCSSQAQWNLFHTNSKDNFKFHVNKGGLSIKDTLGPAILSTVERLSTLQYLCICVNSIYVHNVYATGCGDGCIAECGQAMKMLVYELCYTVEPLSYQTLWTASKFHVNSTMEPLYKGHIGTSYFVHCREVVHSSEVKSVLAL